MREWRIDQQEVHFEGETAGISPLRRLESSKEPCKSSGLVGLTPKCASIYNAIRFVSQIQCGSSNCDPGFPKIDKQSAFSNSDMASWSAVQRFGHKIKIISHPGHRTVTVNFYILEILILLIQTNSHPYGVISVDQLSVTVTAYFVAAFSNLSSECK